LGLEEEIIITLKGESNDAHAKEERDFKRQKINSASVNHV